MYLDDIMAAESRENYTRDGLIGYLTHCMDLTVRTKQARYQLQEMKKKKTEVGFLAPISRSWTVYEGDN